MRKRTKQRNPKILALPAAALVLAALATAARAPDSSGRTTAPSPHARGARAAGPAAVAAVTATVSIDLCATDGSLTPLPTARPGLTIPIWGFVAKGVAADCSDVAHTATLPGPVLSANEGDVVTINVTNVLPGSRTLTFEAPGIDFAAGPMDVAPGATLSRSFTASAPGTYLYESSGEAGRQTAMGLYGALIVRPAACPIPPCRAYDSPSTEYDVDAPLVLSALDPSFNANPDTFDMNGYDATYWLINGRAYPDTAKITAAAGTRVLLRYLNAGFDNPTMMLLGMHERVLARDANLLKSPFDADAETIPAGATEDAIVTVPGSGAGPNGFALYNRQLHVTNGTFGDPAYSPGGMMTFLGP